jgi:hypothetical protein
MLSPRILYRSTPQPREDEKGKLAVPFRYPDTASQQHHAKNGGTLMSLAAQPTIMKDHFRVKTRGLQSQLHISAITSQKQITLSASPPFRSKPAPERTS